MLGQDLGGILAPIGWSIRVGDACVEDGGDATLPKAVDCDITAKFWVNLGHPRGGCSGLCCPTGVDEWFVGYGRGSEGLTTEMVPFGSNIIVA